MKPQRVQRKRTKGWRMPANTVYVGRPTKFGNPFSPVYMDCGNKRAVATYRRLLKQRLSKRDLNFWSIDPINAVWLSALGYRLRNAAIEELRGKNLACWCPPDQPCHADVLLEIANG